MGRRHEWTLFQRRHPDGQQTHETMLNITHHPGNTNQWLTEIPPHRWSEWLKLATQETTDVQMWRNGNPLALLVGMQTGVASLENMCRFLKRLKIELPYDPAIAPTTYLSKGYRNADSKEHMHPDLL